MFDAALKGYVAAIGECSGTFYQEPLNPDGTERKVWIEPHPKAELGPDRIWGAVSAFRRLKGAPTAWDSYSAKVSTTATNMEQSRYDGCLFYRLESSGTHEGREAHR